MKLKLNLCFISLLFIGVCSRVGATTFYSGPTDKKTGRKIFLACENMYFDDGFCQLKTKAIKSPVLEKTYHKLSREDGFRPGKYMFLYWDEVKPQFVILTVSYPERDWEHDYVVYGFDLATLKTKILYDEVTPFRLLGKPEQFFSEVFPGYNWYYRHESNKQSGFLTLQNGVVTIAYKTGAYKSADEGGGMVQADEFVYSQKKVMDGSTLQEKKIWVLFGDSE